MLNVTMAQIILNEAGIRALIGQGEAAGMAEHVGMGGQGQIGHFAITADGRPDGLAGQRGAALADEEGFPRLVQGGPLFQPRLDEPQFIGPQGMRGRKPLLEPSHMQHPAFGIDLRQLQPTGFRHPQAMTEQEQEQAAVAGFVPCPLDGGQQPVHFAGRQVFAVFHRFVSSRGWATH